MREIRQSGSEGGGTGKSTGPPYPYHALAPLEPRSRGMADNELRLGASPCLVSQSASPT